MNTKEDLIAAIDALPIPDNTVVCFTLVGMDGTCNSKVVTGKDIRDTQTLRSMCFTALMSISNHMYEAFMADLNK